MELYILDSNLLRTEVVESYESLIWTERYNKYGDFQIDIDPASADIPLMIQGTYLGLDKSQRVMYIDSVETQNQEDGTRLVVIKGKSLEAKLMERPNNYASIKNGSAPSPLIRTGLPAAIMRTIFNETCRTNPDIANDAFPFIQADSYSSTGHIAEPSGSVTIQSPMDTLYNTLKDIAEVYKLGFRLIRVADDSKLYFEVYTGYDRTSSQTARDAVVFSADLDNLTGTSELTTSENWKNTAYVFAPNGSRIVYGSGADASTTGFSKKILLVDASDITDTDVATLNAKLDQRGAQELAKNQIALGFDGQIPNNGSYVYGTHYMLGDLVEKRSESGTVTQMMVTEQIFAQDKEGEKSYPTLTIDSVIAAGSWDAVSAAKYWDIYTTEVWDNM